MNLKKVLFKIEAADMTRLLVPNIGQYLYTHVVRGHILVVEEPFRTRFLQLDWTFRLNISVNH